MHVVDDKEAGEFLKALDECDFVEVSEWEAKFIADNLGRTSFTERQMESICKMMAKYSARGVKW